MTANAATAAKLWTAFRAAQERRYYANVAVNDGNESLICDLNITTPEDQEQNCAELRRAEAAYDTTLTVLKAFYATHYGETGTAVLDEFLAAETERANIQSDYAHFKAYSESQLFINAGMGPRNAEAAERTATKIDPAQRRLDEAQAALDALTGVRVN